MAVFEEIRAAVGCLTAFTRPAAGASRPALAGGLAFYPVVGLALGGLAAGVATATETVLPAAALVGRARFREFGWASVTALGMTLAVGEPIGLVIVLAASLATVGMRVGAYRRLGGLTGRLLAATRELVETVVLVTLGVLAQLKT